MPKQFLRRDSIRHSKLGNKRPKLQKWRKPKGRDNKMRLKRKGYPKVVSIGYKKPKREQPVLVYNIEDLKNLTKESKIILARVGMRKKLEIIKHAQENKIKILNFKEAKNETGK